MLGVVPFPRTIALHCLYAAVCLPCFSLKTAASPHRRTAAPPHCCIAAVFDFSTCHKVGCFLIDAGVSGIYAFGALKGVSRHRETHSADKRPSKHSNQDAGRKISFETAACVLSHIPQQETLPATINFTPLSCLFYLTHFSSNVSSHLCSYFISSSSSRFIYCCGPVAHLHGVIYGFRLGRSFKVFGEEENVC